MINNVPGALAIAEVFDRTEWVSQSGNPVSYASFIRQQPLQGNAAKPVIFQFAKGDMTVPNPTASAILRAGGLADRATYFRNDLAYANDPGVGKNPHTFLTNIGSAAGAPYAIAAQRQIATFFTSQGATTIDPDGAAAVSSVVADRSDRPRRSDWSSVAACIRRRRLCRRQPAGAEGAPTASCEDSHAWRRNLAPRCAGSRTPARRRNDVCRNSITSRGPAACPPNRRHVRRRRGSTAAHLRLRPPSADRCAGCATC